MRGWSCEALIASGRTRSRRDAARYGAESAPNAVRLLDRSHSTHRGRGVLSLREVAGQLQLHVRQLTDAGCVFGKPNFTTKRLSVAPPNRDLGQSHSSLGVVGNLDGRRSDRHLQFRSRFTARTVSQIRPVALFCPAMACRGVVTVALCKIALPGSPAAANVASNIPANPTSRFILRSFPQTGKFSTKQTKGGCPTGGW